MGTALRRSDRNGPTPRQMCQPGSMMDLRTLGRVSGWTCIALGGVQLLGGVRVKPGMTGNATADSQAQSVQLSLAHHPERRTRDPVDGDIESDLPARGVPLQ